MSEIKHFRIKDLFTTQNGPLIFTKEYCLNHQGTYPVFSGKTSDDVFSNIDSYTYDGNYLTWAIDGLAGYMKVLNGKFSITNHRGILLPIDKEKYEQLYPEYLKFVLEPIFRKNKKGRLGINNSNEYTSLKIKAVLKIKDTFPIPVNKDGTFDFLKQKEIAEKYKKIENMKKVLLDQKKKIDDFKIGEFEGYNCKEFILDDLFTPQNGNSKLTKAFCNNNKGIYEVYTGTTIGSFGAIDTYKYDSPHLSFTTDGEYAGTVQVLEGKYSVGGHRTLLLEKKQGVNILYFNYVLSDIIKQHYKNGDVPSVRWNNIKNSYVPVPVDKNGELDYESQSEIARKYQQIDKIKKELNIKINELIQTDVSFS